MDEKESVKKSLDNVKEDISELKEEIEKLKNNDKKIDEGLQKAVSTFYDFMSDRFFDVINKAKQEGLEVMTCLQMISICKSFLADYEKKNKIEYDLQLKISSRFAFKCVSEKNGISVSGSFKKPKTLEEAEELKRDIVKYLKIKQNEEE